MNTFPSELPHGSRARRNSIVALALASTALVALAAEPGLAAGALPTGGAFAAGAGTISATSSGLAINQTSARGIITWQGFSIGAGELVQFNNGAGATLNRVTGTNISTIAGMLRATGSVYLVNPYGVMIAPGGQVITTGSFVASTRDIANTAFMQGGTLEFQGTSAGTVVNQGTITSSSGDVFLIGQSVENDGEISAANGTAGLAAGDDVLLQPATGDQRIFISAGSGNATNTGTIAAAQAELNAAGGNVYALAGNTGGVVSATGTATVNGHVWLTAGQNIDVAGTVSAKNADGSGGEVDMAAGSSSGTLTVSGAVDTSSASGNGGTVTMTAATVSLADTAVVTASGAANGGIVLVGGDRGGGADPSLDLSPTPIVDAQQTSIAAGASITADAGAGNGGSVVVWSQQETDFAGSISAQGGAGESGGFVEVSSHDLLGFTGTVDLLASGGTTGTLLLDPANVTITTSATSNEPSPPPPITTYAPTSGSAISNILNTDLETALASSSVVVTTTNSGTAGSGAGTITVTAPVSWSSSSGLTLSSASTMTIEAPISWSGSGGLTLAASGGALNIENTITHSGSTAAAIALSSSATTNLNIIDAGQVNLLSSDTLKMGGTTFTLVSSLGSMTSTSGDYALLTSLTGVALTTPVISASSTFTGIFDGLGHTISGSLTDNAGSARIGLFSTSGGTIRNIGLTNWSVSSSGSADDIGGLVGYNSGTILNAYVTGTGSVASTTTTAFGCNCGVGGLAGIDTGTIISSYATVDVSAAANGGSAKLGVGGLVGYGSGVVIKGSDADGGTESDSGAGSTTYVGGMVGYLASGTIDADFGIVTLSCSACTAGNTGQFAGGLGSSYTSVSITVSAASNSKTYDGTTTAAATPTVTSGSLDSGDTLTASESYASANAGAGLTVAVNSGFTISYGSSSTNYYYTVSVQNSTGGTINAAVLTVTPGAVSTTYSGTALDNASYSDTTANYSITGFVAGQTLTSTGIGLTGSLAFNGSTSTVVENAGTYTQSAGTLALSGTSNYSLSFSNPTPNNYVIAPAVLTVTPDAVSTTYSGTALNNTSYSDNTANYSVTGFVAGQTVTSAGITLSGSMAFNGLTSTVVENAGTYAQSSGTLSLASSNSNYTMSFTNPTPNNYMIVPAGISVVLSGSEVYDGSATIADVTAIATPLSITNLDVGDIAAVSGSLTLAGKNVGVETITGFSGLTLGGADASNYTLSGATGSVTITAAPLTVTAAANSKTYDATTTAATLPTITSGTLYGTDTADFSESYAGKNVGSAITLSPTGTVNDGDGGQDYSVAFVTANSGTISPASLTLTAATNSKTYDATTTAAAAPTVTGLQGTDTVTNLGEAYTTANAGTGLTLGVSAGYVVNDGDGGNDYTVTLVQNTTGVIAAAPLTVTPNAVSTTYDAVALNTANYSGNTANYTITGFVAGQSLGSTGIGLTGALAFNGSTTTTVESAGTYTQSQGSLALSGTTNYALAFSNSAPNDYVIAQKALTVSGLAAANKVYDGTDAATLSGTGSLGSAESPGSGTGTDGLPYTGDTVTLAGSAAGTFAQANVGTGITVNLSSSLSLTGTNALDYTLVAPTSLTANITPAALTITADSTSKTYGQAVTFAGTEFMTSGLVGSDSVGSVMLTSAGAAATAGVTGSPYTIVPSSATGSGLGNYTISYVNGELAVTPLAVVLGGTEVYNATTSVSASSLTVSNLIGSDSVTLSGSATLLGANVGAETITGTALSLAGSSAADYTLTGASGSVTVTAKALTVSGLAAANKVYDGTDAATLSGTGSLGSAESPGSGTGTDGLPYTGDTVTLAGSAAGTFAQANVGTGITVNLSSSLSLAGANALDYTLVAPTSLTASITPAALTITADSTSKTYGQAVTFAGTEFMTSGLVGSDSVGSVMLTSAGAAATAGVTGSPYTIVPSSATGSGLGNYTISYVNGELTVNPLPVSLSGSEIYNGSTTAPAAAGAAFGLSVANLVGSDSVTLSGSATLAGADAGTETIASLAGLTLGGPAATNYTLTGGSGSVTVHPLPVSLSGSETYDGSTSVAASILSVANLVAGDTLSLSGSATLADKNAGAEAFSSLAGLTLGGASADNYTLTAASGSVTVSPLTVTLGGSDTYSGTNSAAASGLTVANLLAGDTVTLSGAATIAGADVGAETITGVTRLALGGASAADYTLTGASGSVTISQAPLTIAADNETMLFGATSLPPLDISFSGFVGGDNSSVLSPAPVATTTATISSPVGIYPITVAGAGAANYLITYVEGRLSIVTELTPTPTPTPTPPPPPTTPSAAAILASTVPPIATVAFTPTLVAAATPPAVALLGAFPLNILAQQFNAIAPAAGAGTPPTEPTPQHPGLNVVCAASGGATLTITCSQ